MKTALLRELRKIETLSYFVSHIAVAKVLLVRTTVLLHSVFQNSNSRSQLTNTTLLDFVCFSTAWIGSLAGGETL